MRGQTNRAVLGHRLQAVLRKQSTDAERLLWRHLRGRQMAGWKFRRQHPFGDYILDFVCIEGKLVVELDGGQHLQHVAADQCRDAFLTRAGFRVLRFWDNQVLRESESVLEAIRLALVGQPHPHPSPPLEGEGAAPPPFKGGARGGMGFKGSLTTPPGTEQELSA